MRYHTGQIPPHVLNKMPKADREPMGKAGLTNDEANTKQDARAEKVVHGHICNWLRLQGIPYVHVRMDKKSGIREGWPDFSLVVMRQREDHPGLLFPYPVAFEVKVGRNKMSAEQIQVMAEMLANGWTYKLVSSLAEVIQALA